MKKVLRSSFCLILAMIIFSAQSMAFTIGSAGTISNPEQIAISEFDESEIYDAFTEVNDLVSYIQANEGVTYNDLESVNSELISNVSSSAALIHHDDDDYRTPPIFSAFIWGCLLNWVGMVIVGLTTGFDGRQITKSAWGCLINSLLLGASYWGYFTY
jgi:hypothetical protein